MEKKVIDLGATDEKFVSKIGQDQAKSNYLFYLKFAFAFENLLFAIKNATDSFRALPPIIEPYFVDPKVAKLYRLRGSNRTKRLRKKQWKHYQAYLSLISTPNGAAGGNSTCPPPA